MDCSRIQMRATVCRSNNKDTCISVLQCTSSSRNELHSSCASYTGFFTVQPSYSSVTVRKSLSLRLLLPQRETVLWEKNCQRSANWAPYRQLLLLSPSNRPYFANTSLVSVAGQQQQRIIVYDRHHGDNNDGDYRQWSSFRRSTTFPSGGWVPFNGTLAALPVTFLH
ncbi:hypothetical protein TYRP_010739 [Tyrophagus putrescentiae]|nr:hypothetical protein TYRP_010739 [Tyrophagus putrescentiae]